LVRITGGDRQIARGHADHKRAACLSGGADKRNAGAKGEG